MGTSRKIQPPAIRRGITSTCNLLKKLGYARVGYLKIFNRPFSADAKFWLQTGLNYWCEINCFNWSWTLLFDKVIFFLLSFLTLPGLSSPLSLPHKYCISLIFFPLYFSKILFVCPAYNAFMWRKTVNNRSLCSQKYCLLFFSFSYSVSLHFKLYSLVYIPSRQKHAHCFH